MKKAIITSCVCFALWAVSAATAQETVVTRRGASGVPATVAVEAGPGWVHTFRLGGIIPVKTAPQIAVWAESPEGEYLATLYVSRRSATQDWKGGGHSTRRPEALPCWSHRRGVRYSDGLYMPTAGDPLPDAETSATPGNSFILETVIPGSVERVILFAEFNHSFDYNRHFPKNATPGKPGYSGVSGQPSVIFSGEYRPAGEYTMVEMRLAGYGSPDGTNGAVNGDLGVLTTAKEIVRRMTVKR